MFYRLWVNTKKLQKTFCDDIILLGSNCIVYN